MNNLFNQETERLSNKYRPKTIEELKGHFVIKESLKQMLNSKKLMNILLYGSSGIGKTTIVNIIANEFGYNLYTLNATKLSKEELLDTINKAKNTLNQSIIFIDEIHRLNKLQQDYLLEDTEKNQIIFIGATTENPYGSINKALLSRMILYKLEKLSDKDIENILDNILLKENIKINEEIKRLLIETANGDARVSINNLELIILSHLENSTLEEIKQVISIKHNKDRVNYISAMIKSIRGSDIDASIYWLAALLLTDVDIEYIARRLVISASEDIGLANPNALIIANSCLQSVKEIGMPEARIILSETVSYLAMSPKSNSSYLAINKAMNIIEYNGVQEVPYHLTHLGKKEYKYPHEYSNSYVKQDYMKENIKIFEYGNNKIENKFKEYMEKIKNEYRNR